MLGQFHCGKQARNYTDSSWQAMQVIKAELNRDRLGKGEWGFEGVEKGQE